MAAELTRPAARGIFSSLSSRNYRLFFWGQLISVCGTWMQWVAQSFLVLQLTNSGTDLGLATAARFVPIFLFGPWGGLVADRVDKRRVLYITQLLSGLLALAFGMLVGLHAIEMWMVYLLAIALGFVNVFDNPARQMLAGEMRSGRCKEKLLKPEGGQSAWPSETWLSCRRRGLDGIGHLRDE